MDEKNMSFTSTGLTIRSDTNTRFRAYVTAIPALNREFVSDRMVNPVCISISNSSGEYYKLRELAPTATGSVDSDRGHVTQPSLHLQPLFEFCICTRFFPFL